jgi:ubiquitin C-terminal hydrolase
MFCDNDRNRRGCGIGRLPVSWCFELSVEQIAKKINDLDPTGADSMGISCADFVQAFIDSLHADEIAWKKQREEDREWSRGGVVPLGGYR